MNSGRRFAPKLLAVVGIVIGVVTMYVLFGDSLTLESLAEREDQLQRWHESYPLFVYFVAFVGYAALIGLSLPTAAALTLLFGWYFGLVRGVALVSFASTTGCMLAFLLSRTILRQGVNVRFGARLAQFNSALERDGAFYLFTLRMIPLVPLFVINLVMGLTPMRARTFWWVSQVGMLPGTIVYVYAGSSVPSLRSLADEGIGAVLTPARATRIIIAFALVGVFPLLVRLVLRRLWPSAVNGDRTRRTDDRSFDAHEEQR